MTKGDPRLRADPDLAFALRVAYAIQDHGYPTQPAPAFSDPRYQGNLNGYWQQVAIWAVQLHRDHPDLSTMPIDELQALIDKHRVEIAEAWGIHLRLPISKDWGAEFDAAARNVGKQPSATTKAANTAALLAGLSLNFGQKED